MRKPENLSVFLREPALQRLASRFQIYAQGSLMRLYSGTTKSLIEDSTCNRIATKLKDAFFQEFRFQPSAVCGSGGRS